MIKTTYSEVNESLDAIKMIQTLKIPFGVVMELSDTLVILEEKMKSYYKTIKIIKEKFYPKDENGEIIFMNKEKTKILPTNQIEYAKETLELNNRPLEIKIDKIKLIMTDTLLKSDFTVEYYESLKWLIDFKR